MAWPTEPNGFLRQFLGVDQLVALITGGASGIGLAAAELFAAAGMKVYILDFNEASGNEQAARIDACGYPGSCAFQKVDVTSELDCQTAVQTINKETQRSVEVLFNCAGLSIRDANMDNAQRERLWSVNVDGTELMCQAVIPQMKSRGFGRIINMGSAVGFEHVPFPLGSNYKRSKEWVHKRTLQLALELATYGITVNALAPGRVLTAMVTMPGKGWVSLSPDPVEAFRNGCATQATGTMLLPTEVAGMALYLCSPLARNVTGTIVDMTAGWATAGHKPYPPDIMPLAFYRFRKEAQATTETKIMPSSE